MRKGLEFSFNPEFISAELAESLAQAMSQWIARRGEDTGTAQGTNSEAGCPLREADGALKEGKEEER